MISAESAGLPNPPLTLAVAEVLGDLPLAPEDASAIQGARLLPPVSAALRAALDWLAGEGGPSRPLRARADDAALEITLERVDGRRLEAAGEVLAAAGGSLGQSGSTRPDAPWTVRVPLHAGREQFLMVLEGGIPIAIPWVSVLHITMARPGEVEAAKTAGHHAERGPAPSAPGEGEERWPRLAELGRGARPGALAERPVVLLGHGLKRGRYVADRLVWKLAAAPADPGARPPAAALSRMVATEEGARYWVVDPALLLEPVAVPAYQVPPLEPMPARLLTRADVEPVGREAAPSSQSEPGPAPSPRAGAAAHPRRGRDRSAESASSPASQSPKPSRGALASQRPRPVSEHAPAAVPMARTPEPREPASPAAPAPQPAAPAEARVPGSKIALIAEDSIIAGLFLTRLLEQQGFQVRVVMTAAELGQELRGADWTLVCVDVELPDRPGTGHLRETREALEAAAGRPDQTRAALVALVRDAEDIAHARTAGIPRTLRKPFDRGALIDVLRRAGLLPGEPA